MNFTTYANRLVKVSPAETVIRAVVADPVLTSIERKRAHGWVSEEQKKEISYVSKIVWI